MERDRVYVGAMRSALVGTGEIWSDPAAESRLAAEIFGTPDDHRTRFTEPHGVLGLANDFLYLNIVLVWFDAEHVKR